MEGIFKELIDLKIYPADSDRAKQYNIRASTAVLIDGQIIPQEMALSESRMEGFLREKILESEMADGKR
jgi:hypothetical protein